MKKPYIYSLVILLALIAVGVVSIVTDNKYIPKACAFVEGYIPTPPTLYEVSPYTVNDFDTNHTPVAMAFPPLASEIDYLGWQRTYFGALPYPTPQILDCANSTCNPDIMVPGSVHGSGFLRVEWTGDNGHSPQYIHLTNYANAAPGTYGKNFQNIGCGGGSVTATGSVTTTAGDWGCYEYLRLYTYLNFGANNGTAPSVITQKMSLYDGNITITTGAIPLEPLGFSVGSGIWTNHLTVSLNYLSNQYDAASGHYFSVTNITDVIIVAPETDYSNGGLKPPTVPAAFPTPGSHSLFVYYDWLMLGDSTAVQNYQSPGGMIVTTAYGPPASPVEGACIYFNPLAPGAYDAAMPPTGYHIYRSLSSTLGTGPWVPVTVAPTNVTYYVDTDNYGGGTFCYKILTCNNGAASIPEDFKLNTINASYNEPKLNETIVIEKCGYVAARPTFTRTATITPTYAGSPTSTWTPGWATPTNTPVASVPPEIQPTNAYVFPNPFNPNSISSGYGGSGLFHVSNVKVDTKIHIYAMDGSLVKDGVFTSGAGFTWDGKNKNGSKVVSGLYYLVLEDPQHKTAVFRIIVCYKCNPVYTP